VTLPTDKIGKTYPPHVYLVGREKIREYAAAVGERGALYNDPQAARAAGYPDVVAPPMFVVVYCAASFQHALADPELGIDLAHLVHGAQRFVWGEPVVAGDEITTTLEVTDIAMKAGFRFDTFRTTSLNQRGELTCTGEWSTIVRGQEER